MTAAAVLSGTELEELLDEHYGLRVVRRERQGSECDQVEFVLDDHGIRCVAKISNRSGVETSVRWQHKLLRAARRASGVHVPRILTTCQGDDLVRLRDGCVLRLYYWIDGTRLADLETHSPRLLRQWGAAAAALANTLADITPPPGLETSHHWELLRAREAVDATIDHVTDRTLRRTIEVVMARFDQWAAEGFESLPRGVVHQDLNDFNVLAAPDASGQMTVSGALDFADALHTAVVAELAVVVAYAMTRKPDPLAAAMHVVAGYLEHRPLADSELSAIFPLAAARLCVNASTWSSRTSHANGHYATERMRHTPPTLERLVAIPPSLAEAAFASLAGNVYARGAVLADWLSARRDSFAAVLGRPLVDADLSAGTRQLDITIVDDGTIETRPGAALAALADGQPVAGRHLTSRFWDLAPRRTRGGESPTIHLGVDIWVPGGEPLRAPLDSIVDSVHASDLVLRHDPGPTGQTFWSRWSGLRNPPAAGSRVTAGQELGIPEPGAPGEAVSVNVQLFTDRELLAAVQEHVPLSLVDAWSFVSPDPSLLLGVERLHGAQPSSVELLQARTEHFASSQRTYYDHPVQVVRASGVSLIDEAGRTYLDAINNVSHVGHANRAVTRALIRQTQRLNTNSRFLYDSLSHYAARLTALLPDPLEVVFFVCTGSEANDLALRIAREVTDRRDLIVIDGAYHGNTTAVTNVSPNRYKGPGGHGTPKLTHEAATPDGYRGRWGYDAPDAGTQYAADIARISDGLRTAGSPPAAFIAESLMGTAGCIVHPPGYLEAAFAHARRAGALCISDEVQVGFGRFGTTFWGFEDQGVCPDIVTMGKPIGNGHPLAALVTTREIAAAFDQGMRYFNTFGGNPVSCEVGLAVLDEIRDHGLQQRANDVGTYFLAQLRTLQERHPAIGDVRGRGLYLGVDIVRDPSAKTPDALLAHAVSEQMKDEGIIVVPTGTANNVLKIKPPMIFGRPDVDLFVNTLARILSDSW